MLSQPHFHTGPAVVAKIMAVALLTLLAACSTAKKAQDSGSKASAPQASLKVDPTGRWCFTDSKGRNRTNSVELVQGGVIVGPVGRKGREVFYTDAGPNRYRYGDDAFYEFRGNDQGQWQRRGENRALRRCD